MTNPMFDSSQLIGKVFDSEQKEVLVKFGDSIKEEASKLTEKTIMEALDKRGIDQEILGLSEVDRAALKLSKRVKKTREIWDNNGWAKGCKDKITYADLAKKDRELRADWEKSNKMLDGVFSTDQPMLIPRVIEQVVREPIEPNLVLTGLLKPINVSSAGTTITFPAIGAIMNAADIPEGGEYPEGPGIELAGEITAKIGKSGIAVKITEEMVRYSMFDVMSMHLRAAGAALRRHKEQKVADMIFSSGSIFFDGTAANKQLSGRDIAGSLNGTMTLDDILLMYADMANDGFIPDTLIVHPFTWFAFAREPVMRSIFMQGFGGGMYYKTFEGEIGSPKGQFAGGGLNNKNYFSDPQQVATTYTLPGLLPTPLSVIVTPFQEVDVAAGTATITLCQRSELGMLLTDENVTTEEWNDPARDIMKVKLRERYAVAVSSNGKAIKHAKNVNWRARGYTFEQGPQLTWQLGSGTITAPTQPNLGNNSV